MDLGYLIGDGAVPHFHIGILGRRCSNSNQFTLGRFFVTIWNYSQKYVKGRE